jgi:CHASE3 domain sensor protein
MTDDRIVRVLEEIRDLQRQHGERYGEALRNQEESIRLQQTALRRVRVILAFATIAVILAVTMLVLLLLRVVARLQ